LLQENQIRCSRDSLRQWKRVSPPRRKGSSTPWLGDSSDSEGGSTDGKYRNNFRLIPESINPEESQTPFKQLHLLGARVFIRSAAVITRYVSEAAVPAGKGDGIGKRTRLQISSRISRVESPLAIRSHTAGQFLNGSTAAQIHHHQRWPAA
jgi:hypothetical protein